jgi:hypothetical protein
LTWNEFLNRLQNSAGIDEQFLFFSSSEIFYSAAIPYMNLNFALLKNQTLYLGQSVGSGFAQLFVEPSSAEIVG